MITPAFVKRLIEAKGHTMVSAAREIGRSDRTVRRWCRDWPGWRPPPMANLIALRGLTPRRGPR